MVVTEGNDITLRAVLLEPGVRMGTWRKDGSVLIMGGRYSYIVVGGSHILTVTGSVLDDAGQYSLDAGLVMTTGNVQVRPITG